MGLKSAFSVFLVREVDCLSTYLACSIAFRGKNNACKVAISLAAEVVVSSNLSGE
jgi:hypothetical protein